MNQTPDLAECAAAQTRLFKNFAGHGGSLHPVAGYVPTDQDRADMELMKALGYTYNPEPVIQVTMPPGATLADVEKLVTVNMLRTLRNNRRKTAIVLGISLKTLYNRLHAWGLMTPSLATKKEPS